MSATARARLGWTNSPFFSTAFTSPSRGSTSTHFLFFAHAVKPMIDTAHSLRVGGASIRPLMRSKNRQFAAAAALARAGYTVVDRVVGTPRHAKVAVRKLSAAGTRVAAIVTTADVAASPLFDGIGTA
jgi:hypothetical protein